MSALPAGHTAPAASDIVEQARQYWREITESDGGESGEMALFRELCDEIERLRALPSTAEAPSAWRDALEAAKQFIENGLELGYIRMPTMATDPAHKTLPLIIAALKSAPPKEQESPACRTIARLRDDAPQLSPMRSRNE